MKFAVINAHLPNYAELASLTTFANRREYCDLHGYDLLVKTEGFAKTPLCRHPVSWDRLDFTLDALLSGKYDWVWISGTDSLNTNMRVGLESITDDTHHVIASCDWCVPFQADSILIRNSDQGIVWLKHIISLFNKYKDHVWVENKAIVDTLDQFAGVVKTLPQRVMNSYDYSVYKEQSNHQPILDAHKNFRDGIDWFGQSGQWQQGDFLIHWPGIHLQTRIALVKKYTPLIVR